jgi:glycosyltransferase involved in cell wall biosynthesis
VELIVALMAEELARRGHKVTVFAPGDSRVSTQVISVVPTGYHHDSTIWNWKLAEFLQLGMVYERASEFDVISSHVYCYALPFTRLVATPTVHTFHICPPPDFVRFCRMYPDGIYILLSEFQRQFIADVPVAGVIPNGIDTASFSFNPKSGKYLAYLGDFRPSKGPLESIRCAHAAGIPIKLAGPESKYFHDTIKPRLDGRNVEYVGEVDHHGKVSLLSEALALIFPVRGLEACPMVLLESMACGTPVVALRHGPIPEIVKQGVGGIHVDDPSELPNAITQIKKLNRSVVRRFAIDQFDVSRMVDDYLQIFERAIRHRSFDRSCEGVNSKTGISTAVDLAALAAKYERAQNCSEQ